jgi:asparagine synthase (glutamine-hydrolysing)
MCGIWACFHNGKEIPTNSGISMLQKRGPDNTSMLLLTNIILAFSHLKINGNTAQPMHYGRWHVLCNGEIFNHKEIEKSLDVVPPEGVSDCWILPFLFEKHGWESIYQTLDGEYAIIAYDSEKNKLYLFIVSTI